MCSVDPCAMHPIVSKEKNLASLAKLCCAVTCSCGSVQGWSTLSEQHTSWVQPGAPNNPSTAAKGMRVSACAMYTFALTPWPCHTTGMLAPNKVASWLALAAGYWRDVSAHSLLA